MAGIANRRVCKLTCRLAAALFFGIGTALLDRPILNDPIPALLGAFWLQPLAAQMDAKALAGQSRTVDESPCPGG